MISKIIKISIFFLAASLVGAGLAWSSGMISYNSLEEKYEFNANVWTYSTDFKIVNTNGDGSEFFWSGVAGEFFSLSSIKDEYKIYVGNNQGNFIIRNDQELPIFEMAGPKMKLMATDYSNQRAQINWYGSDNKKWFQDIYSNTMRFWSDELGGEDYFVFTDNGNIMGKNGFIINTNTANIWGTGASSRIKAHVYNTAGLKIENRTIESNSPTLFLGSGDFGDVADPDGNSPVTIGGNLTLSKSTIVGDLAVTGGEITADVTALEGYAPEMQVQWRNAIGKPPEATDITCTCYCPTDPPVTILSVVGWRPRHSSWSNQLVGMISAGHHLNNAANIVAEIEVCTVDPVCTCDPIII